MELFIYVKYIVDLEFTNYKYNVSIRYIQTQYIYICIYTYIYNQHILR